MTNSSLAPVPEFPRRLVYLGTPEMAVAPLEALVADGFDVALVVTGADKRRGRGSALTPSPVKAAASDLGIPVSHRVEDSLEVGADLGVVVAYGDDHQAGSTQFVSASEMAEVVRAARASAARRRPTMATGGRVVSLVDGREYLVAVRPQAMTPVINAPISRVIANETRFAT